MLTGMKLTLNEDWLEFLNYLPPGTVVEDEDGAPAWVLDVSHFHSDGKPHTCLMTRTIGRISWSEIMLEPRTLKIVYVPFESREPMDAIGEAVIGEVDV